MWKKIADILLMKNQSAHLLFIVKVHAHLHKCKLSEKSNRKLVTVVNSGTEQLEVLSRWTELSLLRTRFLNTRVLFFIMNT